MDFHPKEYEQRSLAILCKDAVVWRHTLRAGSIKLLAGTPGVKAWLLRKGNLTYVIKHWDPQRATFSAEQVAAEQRASNLLYHSLGCDPLLAAPIYIHSDPFAGYFSISPYAGVCAARLKSGDWRDSSPGEVESRCKTLAACLLMTLQKIETLPDMYGNLVQYQHRDIKLANICYNEEHKYFVLIDFGGFCTADRRDWFGITDPRYIDPYMASIDPSTGNHYMTSRDGMCARTTPSLDLYLTGLAVAELFAGSMPQQLDPDEIEDPDEQLDAVHNFSWASSSQAAAMPEGMRSLLLCLLAPSPGDRPSVSEALAHPWLEDEVTRMHQILQEVAPAWADMMQKLLDDTYQRFEMAVSSSRSSKDDDGDANSMQQETLTDAAVAAAAVAAVTSEAPDADGLCSSGCSSLSKFAAANAIATVSKGCGSSSSSSSVAEPDAQAEKLADRMLLTASPTNR